MRIVAVMILALVIVNGSRYAKMKELRFYAADGVWRFAFAFDPKRQAIVLCGGDKSGGSEKKFYRDLISGRRTGALPPTSPI